LDVIEVVVIAWVYLVVGRKRRLMLVPGKGRAEVRAVGNN
jgi:hypothetical protein